MKIKNSLLLFLLILTSCTPKRAITLGSPDKTSIDTPYSNAEEVSASPPLIIGSKQYRGWLGDWIEIKESYRENKDPVNCTVEDINNILIVDLFVDPEDPDSMNSLKNLELLVNAKELFISGQNLNKVDFSPISSLVSLEKLEIKGNIARIPDLTRLDRLKFVRISDSALESVEGIGGNGIERLLIGGVNNKTLKISDMRSMPELTWFSFVGGKIDLQGIDRFVSLECLRIGLCQPSNLEGIGKLKNLKELEINLISPNPSVFFLKDLYNLEIIEIFGNGVFLFPVGSPAECKATQVLDVSPLASSKKLWQIYCSNFIIKNISTLDGLEHLLTGIDLYGSRLYDETEVSRQNLKFYAVPDR
jgi:Leucine-rich repeat (LRR) protein